MEIIPIFCFLLMIGIFTGTWRERFLLACISWGVLVVVVTESLSLWHGLDRATLTAAWSFILIILGFFWSKTSKTKRLKYAMNFNLEIAVMITMMSGILLVTAVIAYFAAPNNWDSMTCHLARVAHWSQDKTVSLYPSDSLRELLYPPWAEYAIMQFYILADSDRWVNFIQWFSSLGCMIGVSLIAARLNGKAEIQALAALIVATIPMGILQSTSTQNDYVAAFWLVCFVYFGLNLLQKGKWLYCIATAASLGLTCLAKGTGYIYGISFMIWIMIAGIKNQGRQFLARLSVLLLIAVVLNSFYYARNYSLTRTIIPPTESANMIRKKFDLKTTIGKLALNIGLHAATGFERPDQWVEKTVDQILHRLGISQGDERVFFTGEKKFLLTNPINHEDFAGNFIHSLLIMFCLVVSFWPGQPITKEYRIYALSLLGAVVFFLIMLKWSIYHSRYHLPVFILFAPFLALVLGCYLKSRERIVLGLILVMASIPWIVDNKTRPLIGAKSVFSAPRGDQYFFERPETMTNYEGIAKQAQMLKCREVGIVSSVNSWKYPLWVLLKKQQPNLPWRIEYVMVDNVSNRLPYPLGKFNPCAVVTLEDQPLGAVIPTNSYTKVWSFRNAKGLKTAVYVPAGYN
jgi:4-amino-4-deoxy-L-arabinose transferase-like glycosyltransferase